jgi:hypothetical protein
MKKTSILHLLLVISVIGTLMFSCTSEELNNINDNSEVVNLVMPSEQTVDFKINYDVPKGCRVVFEVYAENPFDVTADGFGKKMG